MKFHSSVFKTLQYALIHCSSSGGIKAKSSRERRLRACHKGHHAGNFLNGTTSFHGNLVRHVRDLCGWHVIDHLRPYNGRCQGIACDTTTFWMCGIFFANGFGQSNHGRLGGGIGQHTGIALLQIRRPRETEKCFQ